MNQVPQHAGVPSSTNVAEGAAGSTLVQAAAIHGDVHVHGRRPPVAVPHHLPSPTKYFVNRHRELAALTSLLNQPTDQRPAVVVLVGLPGIGSSALAETWLAGQQDRFPDGVFSTDLADTAVSDVLGQFLRAAGIPRDEVPDTLAERTQLWRTRTATTSIAVLLDHPQPDRDILPLLPAGARSLTVVISHQPSISLLAQGAHQIHIGSLDQHASSALVRRYLQAHGLDASPDAVTALTDLCGGHPRALRLAVASIVARPHRPIPAAIATLRHEHARHPHAQEIWMSPEHAADTSVTAGIVAVHTNLSTLAAQVYPVLGLLPAGRVSAELLSAATGVDRCDAEAVVTELADGSLLEPAGPGNYVALAAVARHARALSVDSNAARHGGQDATVHRIVVWYLQAVRVAAALVLPARRALPWENPPTTLPLPLPTDLDSHPLDWLDRERLAISSAVALAVGSGLDRIAVLLADAVQPLFIMLKDAAYIIEVDQQALQAALRAGDQRRANSIIKRLVRALIRLGELDQAQAMHAGQEQQARAAGDRRWLASAVKTTGLIAAAQGDPIGAGISFAHAVTILRDLGYDRAEGLALIEVADATAQAGDDSGAVGHLRRARALLTGLDTPDAYNAARAEITLARALLHSAAPGAEAEIRALLDAALATMVAHGSTVQQARAHDTYADHAEHLGRPGLAAEHRAAALELRGPC